MLMARKSAEARRVDGASVIAVTPLIAAMLLRYARQRCQMLCALLRHVARCHA